MLDLVIVPSPATDAEKAAALAAKLKARPGWEASGEWEETLVSKRPVVIHWIRKGGAQ